MQYIQCKIEKYQPEMTKILITGAGGYIGSIATYLFLQEGYKVVAIDNFSTGYKQPLETLQKKYGAGKLHILDFDLTKDDCSSLFKNEKGIEAVIHYAAHCSVDESMKDPQKYFANNILGTLNMISAMVENGINNLVFSSTCAVYGQSKYVPLDENHPKEPFSPYGESKKITEDIIGWFGKLKGLNFVILRYFNVCGASDDGLIGDSKKPSSLLVQNAVRGALGIEPFLLTFPEVDTKDKSPVRDYINVVDLNTAHKKAIEYLLRGGNSEVINLGTGIGNSVLEIIKKAQEITGVKFDVKKGNAREGDPANLVASIEKAKKVLNWKPQRTIEDSIRSLVLWYKKNPHGWKK